jgi:nucleoside-triphosphatase
MVPEGHRPVRIVLTGAPGCGKTTAVRRIVAALDMSKVAGFYTEEIREAGRRAGFQWHRLDGRWGILAHVNIRGPHRVGKYGVDVEGFDRDAVSALDPDTPGIELFVVDEIGKMECFSEKFVQAIRRLLASEASVVATVALKGGGLIRDIKNYPGVRLFHLTPAKRDDVARQITGMLAGPAIRNRLT